MRASNKGGAAQAQLVSGPTKHEPSNVETVTCYPLYTLLKAMQTTNPIDYISLDIEGNELKVRSELWYINYSAYIITYRIREGIYFIYHLMY